MPSIYEGVGGDAGVRAAVTVFHRRVLSDERLAAWFDDADLERLHAHQRAFLTAVLGGPDLYAGRELRVAHEGLAITDGAFDLVVAHLVDALADLGMTEEEIRGVRMRIEAQRAAVRGL